MHLKVFADPAVFHPVGDPIRPQKGERPAIGRVDELLPGGLAMMDRLLHVLPQDPPIPHKTLDFTGDMQTYLLICIHLFLCPAADLSEQSFPENIAVFVTIGNIYRFTEILSILGFMRGGVVWPDESYVLYLIMID
jgi:hypothetical protein